MALLTSLESLRREYLHDRFNEKTAKDDPFEQFDIWFKENLESKPEEPAAMTLATCGKDMMPAVRAVLVKAYDEEGFVFYTNYDSRKGRDLAENPKASLLFYWDKLERQIRIYGQAEKISREESEEYFQTRSYESKLGAWASRQSSPLKSRESLMRDVAALMIKYPKKVPLPPHWGGYRLLPEEFEFWQGRESRLHDRIAYKLIDRKWKKMRLYP